MVLLVLAGSGCAPAPAAAERTQPVHPTFTPRPGVAPTTLPTPSAASEIQKILANYNPFQTTRFYDRHGTLLYEVYADGRRIVVPLEKIPLALQQATIATEDKTFYTNPGVDPRGIARAAWLNLNYGQIVAGGSTITQQLVRMLAFPYEERVARTMSRKIREAQLAIELTRLLPKDRILEMYLNEVYYGNQAYGVEAAAQTYFAKHVWELNLAECALLAGLPQSPERLNPFVNPGAAKARQRNVLRLMTEAGYITPEEAEAAFAQPLEFKSLPRTFLAPHFVLYVQEQLERRYGRDLVRRGGLKVITTLDLRYQGIAELILRQQVNAMKERHHLTNMALVAMRPSTGEILAMVGSVDFSDPSIDGQVNVAIRPRQPGSAFKPITYVTAFAQAAEAVEAQEAGPPEGTQPEPGEVVTRTLFTPATVVWDVETEFPLGNGEVYVPHNYDERFHGPLRLRDALANSYNVPAVKVLDQVGISKVLEMAHAMGVQGLRRPPAHYGLSLTLGGGEVSLLDLTTAYATLANMGRYVQPVAVLRVEDAKGRVLEEYAGPTPTQVVDPRAAYLVTHILSDNEARTPAFGPNSPLKVSQPAAVKTGTTDDWRDNWTIGYTPYLVVGVWAGNSDNTPMVHTSGVTGAAPAWHDFMETIFTNPHLQDVLRDGDAPLQTEFQRPEGIVEAEICDIRRLSDLASGCPAKRKELFIAGTVPEEEGSTYVIGVGVGVQIPAEQIGSEGQPGAVYCMVQPGDPWPPGAHEILYLRLPEDEKEAESARTWAIQHGVPVAPAPRCTADFLAGRVLLPGGPVGYPAIWRITSPRPGDVLTTTVPVMGSAVFTPDRIAYYKIEFSSERDPGRWITIGDIHAQPVFNGQLETFHADALPPGNYRLRLVLVKPDGNILPPYEVPVIIRR